MYVENMGKVVVFILFLIALLHCVFCVQNVTCISHKSIWYDSHNEITDICYIERFPVSDARSETFHFQVNYAQPSDIKWVEFDIRNVVEYIPKNIFTTFPKMRTLVMATKLSALNAGDFANANSLEQLRLKYNNIKIIRNGIFSSSSDSLLNLRDCEALKVLEELYLEDNEISEIEPNAFSCLKSLFTVSLGDNKLSVINERMFAGLSNLHLLELQENNIERIEAGALDLPTLEDLNLSSNKLKQLPDGIFDRLPALILLNLDHNHLKRLSDKLFDGLPRLSHLWLKHNNLEHIGQSLYRVPELFDIELSGNRIKDIDLIAFAKMPGTLVLDLSDSGFTFSAVDIKVEEQWDSSLWWLDISKNNLSDAMDLNKLRIFPNVSLLILDGNSFRDFEVGSNRTLKDIIPSLAKLYVANIPLSSEYKMAIDKRYKSINVDIWWTK